MASVASGISTSCLGKETSCVSHEHDEDLRSKEHQEESPSAEGLRQFVLHPVGSDSKTDACASAVFGLVNEAALGEGGMAAVYKAHLPASHGNRLNHVALKVFHEGAGKRTDCGDRLLREATMLAAAQGHPNIIRFHGAFDLLAVCEDKGTPHVDSHAVALHSRRALMMEYCDGSDLYLTITQSRLNEDRARGIVRAVLSALVHIHSRGIVHRDVKPANVLMGRDGRPMLVDFGCACRLSDSEELARRCGSPGYAAPEVIRGARVGIEVDSFGVGVMLFLMLYGALPFLGSSIESILRRTLRGKFTFPESSVITLACQDVILDLLHRDPLFRPCAEQALCNPWIADGASKAVVNQEGRLRPRRQREQTAMSSRSEPRQPDVSHKSKFSEPTPHSHPCSVHRSPPYLTSSLESDTVGERQLLCHARGSGMIYAA